MLAIVQIGPITKTSRHLIKCKLKEISYMKYMIQLILINRN